MEGGSKTQKNNKRNFSKYFHDDCTFFQSSWIRCSAILANYFNWEYMERQYRFVLFSGFFLWVIHIFASFL